MDHDHRTCGDSIAEALLAMLQTLHAAPGGAELAIQVERGNAARSALAAVVDQGFIAFAQNAVRRYARINGNDATTRLKVRQIEQRLAKLSGANRDDDTLPELPDTATLAQHLAAQLWAAGQVTPPKPAPPPALPRPEELRPLQQTLAAELDRAALSNLDSIASLGSIELTLKGVAPDEFDGWREILRDATREVIEAYRGLGTKLSHAQLCAKEIARKLEICRPVRPGGDTLTIDRLDLLRRLEAEMRRAQRYHHPLALALLGPDHLENIRDLIGPQAAGEVLRGYLDNVTSCARAYDTVTGCNPHELLWLLPGADANQGVKAVRKAQEKIMGAHYHYAGRLRPLPGFSAGVVGYTPGERPGSLLARAQTLAAQAKRIGPRHIEWDRREIS